MVIDGFELPGLHPTVSLIMLSIAAVDFYDVATAPTVEPGETGCLEHPKESHPKQNGQKQNGTKDMKPGHPYPGPPCGCISLSPVSGQLGNVTNA